MYLPAKKKVASKKGVEEENEEDSLHKLGH